METRTARSKERAVLVLGYQGVQGSEIDVAGSVTRERQIPCLVPVVRIAEFAERPNFLRAT